MAVMSKPAMASPWTNLLRRHPWRRRVRLLLERLASLHGFVVFDDARGQVGVDGHLLTGHRVKVKRANLGDTSCTLGDDDVVDDHQDEEDGQTDDDFTTDDEVTEGLDRLPAASALSVRSGESDGWTQRSGSGATGSR